MKFATVRNLKNQTSEMLRTAAKGTDVLITSHGRPVAVLHGLAEADLEDYVLSHHPEFRRSIEDASRHYQKHGGMSVEEVMKRLKERRGKRRGKVRP
jgi:prevent-host-death family protein